MPTLAQITASVNNSPQHWGENVVRNVDQTTITPPQVAAAITLPNLVLALATTGIIEITS